MTDLKQLHEAVVAGDAKTARAITEQALKENVDPLKLVTDYMAPAMGEVGRRFECNEYFVPELLLSARAMKSALELIRPLLAAQGSEPVGRVVIGTVKGDLHDIGKNLVAAMLEGGGFEVIDLGVNVTPEKFVATAKEKNAHIIAMSALLTTTMPVMGRVVGLVKERGLAARVRTIVGGAPVTDKFAREIGADAYGFDAANAVERVKGLVADRR